MSELLKQLEELAHKYTGQETGETVREAIWWLKTAATLLNEWNTKTKWVQREYTNGTITCDAGMHCADVMREEIMALRAENAKLRTKLNNARWSR